MGISAVRGCSKSNICIYPGSSLRTGRVCHDDPCRAQHLAIKCVASLDYFMYRVVCNVGLVARDRLVLVRIEGHTYFGGNGYNPFQAKRGPEPFQWCLRTLPPGI